MVRKCPWCGYPMNVLVIHHSDCEEFHYTCPNCGYTYVEVYKK